MKNKYTFFILILVAHLNSNAQGGFNQVVDALNPVTTFTSPGFYKGAAWIDFDNDNDLDLFASPNYLFRNDGNGVFVQITDPFAITPAQNPGGSSWADLNNDGYIDCIISQSLSGVYLGSSSGAFINVSSNIAGLNGYPSWACAIGDWNKDAFLDFVFANPVGFLSTNSPCKLYLNSSSAVTPQNIIGYTITDSLKPYTVPYWSDYDLDGDMDLFVASGPGGTPGPDFCYRNLKVETGIDTLQRITTDLFSTQLQDGQCYNFIDFDNDGDLDLCLTNYGGAASRFYVNNHGVYSLLSTPFTAQTNNLANDWGDFDNDGDLDVIITNDISPSKLYKNNGNGTFASAISIGVAGGSGIANGDYDNDGDLDIFIHGFGNARALYRNDSLATGNHWISIKCIGTTSNKSAIGTILKLKATINGNSYWQMREISAQNSFQSENDLRVHFGLGNATTVDSVIIQYPGGTTEKISNVASNIFYSNQEGSGTLSLLTGINESQNEDNKIRLFPNPAKGILSIEIKNNTSAKEIKLNIIDVSGKIVFSNDYSIMNESIQLNTSSLKQGIYLLTLEGQSFHYNAKFIKAEN